MKNIVKWLNVYVLNQFVGSIKYIKKTNVIEIESKDHLYR